MAAKRKGIMDLRQLLQLKIKGLSNRKIEQLLDMHRNTINGYVRFFDAQAEDYEALYEKTDEELASLFATTNTMDTGRYEILCSYFDYFGRELRKTGCTRKALWQEYIEKHPDGYGRSQFNEHLRRYLKRKKVSGKLTHKAGEKIFVDYAGKKLHYIDKQTGEVIEVEAFVGIAPCSMLTYLEASPSQQLGDFIESAANCLEYMDGVPQAIIPDNLKSAVTKGSKYEPVINKTFKDFALHYGTVINPARTRSPQDKALVENAVKLVYQRIYYPISKMTFFSIEDLNAQIRILLKAFNDELLSNLQVSRRQQFESIEREYFNALPAERYEIKTFRRATVQKMGYVFVSENKNYYSVPYRYIGKKVEVRYNRSGVEVYYKQERVAIHKRSYKPGHYITIEDHLSSTHKFYKNWSPAFFEKLARPHGDAVVEYINRLIDQAAYPEVAYKQCLGVINLADKFNPQRLDKACQRAMQYHRSGYRIVKEIMNNKMEEQPDVPQNTNHAIPAHENVRGAGYFQKLLQFFF